MLLQLNVPAIESKPAIPAEVRTSHLQDMLDDLAGNSPEACATRLIDELMRLNRQEFSVPVRLGALELHRRAIFALERDLSPHYCNQPLPLGQQALLLAGLARQLFAELAIGYKQAILALERQRFSLNRDNTLTQLLQRATDALGHQLRISHLTYSSADPGVWAELHTLYRHALQRSLQDHDVPDGIGNSSVGHVYKHALLLALANPSLLPTSDMQATMDYLDRYCDLAQLHALFAPENAAGIFLVNLAVDAAPQPLNKYVGQDDPRDCLLLVSLALAKQIHQHLSHARSVTGESTNDFPEAALQDPAYLDLLQHLLQQWSSPPRREFRRIRKSGVVQLCFGLDAIHRRLSPKAELDATDGGYQSARWLLVDESANGFALSRPAPARESINIGELLALQSDTESDWGIAVARRAAIGETGTLQVGAQMLAPHAHSVWLRLPDTEPLPALLLPELRALNQQATLIAAPGTYLPARTLQLNEAGKEAGIMLKGLLERTPYFERFQFVRL